ncbi:hypothetical protein BASA81_000577 [Batrachochytrium salamandrivorans]|nr:hypothetical protein BASA81_000577 [Batrachochytrium salamandrivorans]
MTPKDVALLKHELVQKQRELDFWVATKRKLAQTTPLSAFSPDAKQFLLDHLLSAHSPAPATSTIIPPSCSPKESCRVYFGKHSYESFAINDQISCSQFSHRILHCLFASSSYYSSRQDVDHYMLVVNTANKPGSWQEEEFSGSSLAVQFLTALGFDADRGFGKNGLDDSQLPPLYLVRKNHQVAFLLRYQQQQMRQSEPQHQQPLLTPRNRSEGEGIGASAFEAFATMVLKLGEDDGDDDLLLGEGAHELALLENAADVLDLAWLGTEHNRTGFLSCAQMIEVLQLTDSIQSCQEAWQNVFEGIVVGASDRQVNVVNFQEFQARYVSFGRQQPGLRDYFGAEIDALVEARKRDFAERVRRKAPVVYDKWSLGLMGMETVLVLVALVLLLYFALTQFSASWSNALPELPTSNTGLDTYAFRLQRAVCQQVTGNVTNLVFRQNRVALQLATASNGCMSNYTWPDFAVEDQTSYSPCLTFSPHIAHVPITVQGEFAQYPNSGYECVDQIGSSTRSVIAEFDLHSPTNGLGAHVMYIAEMDASGALVSKQVLTNQTYVFTQLGLVIAAVCLLGGALAVRVGMRKLANRWGFLLALLALVLAFVFIFQNQPEVLACALVCNALLLALLLPKLVWWHVWPQSAFALVRGSIVLYLALALGWAMTQSPTRGFAEAFSNVVMAGVFPQYSVVLFEDASSFIVVMLGVVFLLLAGSVLFTMVALSIAVTATTTAPVGRI